MFLQNQNIYQKLPYYIEKVVVPALLFPDTYLEWR